MRNLSILLLLLATTAGASAQSSVATADVTAGQAALAAQDLATANTDFAAAVAADPTNQTAAALLGLTRIAALSVEPAAQQYMDGLGISSSGRNIYNFTAAIAVNAQGQPVLPAGYNLTTAFAYYYNVFLPEAANAEANFAAVTNPSFVLTLTAAETGSTSITFDYGDILMCDALLNALTCMIDLTEGQNLNANLADILQLAEGNMLTLQHVISANPSLFLPGSAAARSAAEPALLNAIQLYQAASAFIRARPPGLTRVFMLAPQDAAQEATFRADLSQVQQALTTAVPFGNAGHTAMLAPLFTSTWSARAELPPVTGNAFDTTQIPDPTLGGLLTGYTAADIAALLSPPPPPGVTLQPLSQNVAVGSTVVFAAAATSSPAATYQWFHNGAALTGATSAQLVLNAVTAAQAGGYYVTATNSAGTVSSVSGALTVSAAANPGRLVNLSILSSIQGSLSMGFVSGGAGTSGSQSLLIRAEGPSIGPGTIFGVAGVMTDPTLKVVQQNTGGTVAANAGWGSNSAAVTAADNATGAFALTNLASLDSALVATLAAVTGGYSATVAGASGDSGWALTEVYDDTPNYTPASPRLINLSCLTQIASGSMLDVGFVVGGATAKTLLVRAAGPALHTLYGVGGVMADPQLQIVPLSGSGTVLAKNAGWSGNAQVAAVAASVGAYAFPDPTSLDSAALVTLPPGAYTVQVSSTSGGGGTVLVEIYDVP